MPTNLNIQPNPSSESILEIANSLHGNYFNDQGIIEIEKDAQLGKSFGAYENDLLVGFIIFKPINDQTVELAWMGVDPKFQGQGIGSAMLNQALAQFTNYQVCEVKTLAETVADSGYAKTRNFYHKNGFIPIEIIQPYPGWDPIDPAQIYVKFINQ